MSLLTIILIIGLLLYLFRRQIQLWLLRRVLSSMQERMEQQQYRQTRNAQGGGNRSSTQGQGQKTRDEASTHPHEKVDVTRIDARKFEDPKSGDYVEFEDIPE